VVTVRWEIERYVKLYRRDTPEWLLVPWRARGLFDEMLRKCDLDGTIECGKLPPAQAVVVLLGGRPEDVPEVEQLLGLLLADGCVRDECDGRTSRRQLLIPNYREAQDIGMTGAERTARWRDRQKAKSSGDTQEKTPCDASDAVTRGRHKRHARDGCDAVTDPSRAEPSRAEPSRAEPSRAEPAAALEHANGSEGGGGADLLPAFRQGLADKLAILSSNPLRVAKGERAEAIRRHVERLGLEYAVELCAEHAREVGTVPKYLDWFLDFLGEQETPIDRAPGENPKPTDPDFNDPAAWRDYGEYLVRTDGKTWEEATGLKRPVYVPPKTPEEEATERAAQGVKG
jgi:hypothetical protein